MFLQRVDVPRSRNAAFDPRFLWLRSWLSRHSSTPLIDAFSDCILYIFKKICYWAHDNWLSMGILDYLIGLVLVLIDLSPLVPIKPNHMLLILHTSFFFPNVVAFHFFRVFCIHFVFLYEFWFYHLFKKNSYISFERFSCLVINWKMHLRSLREPASVQLQPSLSGWEVGC
jgi:hypothetical protein